MSNPLYQQTMTPLEQVNLAIENYLVTVDTIMPCKIVSVNYPKVTVQPLINRIVTDENQNTTYLPYGNVPNIPVMTFGNSTFNITLPPPQVGDTGTLLVNEKSVSQVYNSGEILSPRTFNLLDSVYIPQFMKVTANPSDTMTINTQKLVVDASAKIALTAPEVEIDASTSVAINTPDFSVNSPLVPLKFAVQGPIFELLTSLILALTTIKTATTVSGGPFDSPSQTAIQVAITQLMTFL